MAAEALQYPDDLLGASGQRRSEVERELKFQVAVRLFRVGRLSLGQAAELADWKRVRFADELGCLEVPVVNLDEEETEAEVRAIRGTHPCG